jgi:hypothetical protein
MKLSRALPFAALLSAVAAFGQVSTDTPFQVRYAANLNVGDSVVNITNTGARGGVTDVAGTSASVGGAICANIFAFSADEQMVSCCSCPVTPNGLVSLSAKNDLVSNTLTPAVPNSIVIKLLATVPVGGSCSNSAAQVATATLAPGMAAWGTTIHAVSSSSVTDKKNGTVVTTTYGATETAFTPATLSASELARLGSTCTFIVGNGSGFGICRSCRLGGLAGINQ